MNQITNKISYFNNNTNNTSISTSDSIPTPITLQTKDNITYLFSQPESSPDTYSEEEELSTKHASEPFKKLSDIKLILDYLLSQERYRDYMLMVVAFNFGLRSSDLLKLKFSHIINKDNTFKSSFELIEKKTSNTRLHKKYRYIKIGKAVQEAVATYLEHNPNTLLTDYMFTSQKSDTTQKYNNPENTRPITRQQFERIIKSTAKALNIEGDHFSTHTPRKTFGYHIMKQHNNDPRTLMILQQIFGHSSSSITLNYIGITQDEIDEAYDNLNLGLREQTMDSDIFEM